MSLFQNKGNLVSSQQQRREVSDFLRETMGICGRCRANSEQQKRFPVIAIKLQSFPTNVAAVFLRQPPIGCQISLSDWGWCISGEVLMLLALAKNSRARPPDWPAAAVDVCCTRVALNMDNIKREEILQAGLAGRGPYFSRFSIIWQQLEEGD